MPLFQNGRRSQDYEMSSASSVGYEMPNIVEHADGTKQLNLDLHLPAGEHIESPNVHITTTDDNREMLVEVDNRVITTSQPDMCDHHNSYALLHECIMHHKHDMKVSDVMRNKSEEDGRYMYVGDENGMALSN